MSKCYIFAEAEKHSTEVKPVGAGHTFIHKLVYKNQQELAINEHAQLKPKTSPWKLTNPRMTRGHAQPQP